MARVIVTLYFIIFFQSVLVAQESTLAGGITFATGDIVSQDINGSHRILARRSQLYTGDTVSTDTESRVQFRMIDQALFSMGCESALEITRYFYGDRVRDDEVSIRLLNGKLRTITGAIDDSSSGEYRFAFGENSLHAEHSDFEVVFNADSQIAYIAVYDGSINLQTPLGSIVLGWGGDADFARIESGKEPEILRNMPSILGSVSFPAQQNPVSLTSPGRC